MDHAAMPLQHEVVHELAVPGHGLRPHTGRAGKEVIFFELRNETLELPEKGSPAKIAPELHEADTPVSTSQDTKTRIGNRFPEIVPVDVCSTISLAGEGQNGIRPEPHRAIQAGGEMDTEEGKARIGDRIDVGAHEVTAFRTENIVVPTEGHDGGVRSATARSCQAVAEQTSTHQSEACL